jgi:hypothetical protein
MKTFRSPSKPRFGIISLLVILGALFAATTPAAFAGEVKSAPVTQSEAYPNTIFITTPSNRALSGDFFTTSLTRIIAPNGIVGKYILNPDGQHHRWFIDASFLDDVKALAQGTQLVNGTKIPADINAKNFLLRLPEVIGNDPIQALAYGNPSGYWIRRLIPHEQNYFIDMGNIALMPYLSREFTPVVTYLNNHYYSLPSTTVTTLLQTQKSIESISPYLGQDELSYLTLHLASPLYVDLSKSTRNIYSHDEVNGVNELLNRVSLSPGKFTLTSSQEKLPVTISNDFQHNINIRVEIATLNSRVSVPSEIDVVVPGKSKTQLSIPVKVEASGSSDMQLSIYDKKGIAFGQTLTYPLTLSVLSPVATWITTIASILLIAAVIIRSVRKRRKSPVNNSHE